MQRLVWIPDLDLKFVAHRGPAIPQTIADRQELLGFDAFIVHRLTKTASSASSA